LAKKSKSSNFQKNNFIVSNFFDFWNQWKMTKILNRKFFGTVFYLHKSFIYFVSIFIYITSLWSRSWFLLL